MGKPGPRESVRDYPRPPRVGRVHHRLRVVHGGRVLAQASGGYRVLETFHPPCYYLPPERVDWERLIPDATLTFCEFKGEARYRSLREAHGVIADVCRAYDNPVPSHRDIAGHVSFHASRVMACYVDDERVQPRRGAYYGGWITSGIEGPFKSG